MNSRLKNILILITIFLSIYFVLLYFHKLEISNHKQKSITELEKQYETITNNLKTLSKVYYDEIVNKDEILSILENVNESSIAQRDKIRIKLYNKILPIYKRMKEHKFRQFHFHLKDSSSFLRMHKPKKFGDSLTDIRYSIVQTNKTLKPHYGFEEGRIYNGFRNVYPLIYKGKHLGSVEISLSFEAVRDALEKTFSGNFGFVVSKNTVETKVFKDHIKANYTKSFINPNFYFETRFIQKRFKLIDKKKRIPIMRDYVFPYKKDEIIKHSNALKSFSIFTKTNGNFYSTVFLSIKNLQGENVAYIISNNTSEQYAYLVKQFQTKVFISLIVILVLFFIYIYTTQKNELEFVQTILNSQKQPLITVEGNKVVHTNKAFIDFFNIYDSTKQNNHILLERFFTKYATKNKIPNIKMFLEKEETNVLSLKDNNGKISIYNIEATKLFNGYYLITFTDITKLEKEKLTFKTQAYTDKLTSISNRTKFDFDFDHKVSLEENFSLLLLDIDNFKSVNDTYGHDVGDEVLKLFTKSVKDTIRNEDILYRWGGEEFFVIINAPTSIATIAADHILQKIRTTHFPHEKQVTCSIGISYFDNTLSKDDAIKKADDALYKAKTTGKDKYIVLD
jgi:diguanylate cyclase (GGDEF)-like protein